MYLWEGHDTNLGYTLLFRRSWLHKVTNSRDQIATNIRSTRTYSSIPFTILWYEYGIILLLLYQHMNKTICRTSIFLQYKMRGASLGVMAAAEETQCRALYLIYRMRCYCTVCCIIQPVGISCVEEKRQLRVGSSFFCSLSFFARAQILGAFYTQEPL